MKTLTFLILNYLLGSESIITQLLKNYNWLNLGRSIKIGDYASNRKDYQKLRNKTNILYTIDKS